MNKLSFAGQGKSFFLATVLFLVGPFLIAGCDRGEPEIASGGARKILVIAPLTGSGAELGHSSRIGMEMAVEDIAADPSRAKIALVFQDSKTDPKTAVSILASRELYSDEKVVISEMSGVTRALVTPARQADVLLVATLVGAPALGGGSNRFARINVMSDAIAQPLARFAAGSYEKIACLYLNDDYGIANYELFAEAFKATGGQVGFSESFSARQPAEARILVEKVAQSGSQAVFIAGFGPTYVALFRAFKELAPDIQVFADIGIVNAPVLAALGDAANGVYTVATEIDAYPPLSERAVAFYDRFRSRSPDGKPDYVTAYSYDTVTVLNEALAEVPDADPGKIRNFLTSQFFEGYGGRFKIDPTSGDSIYDPLPVFVIRDGKILPVSE